MSIRSCQYQPASSLIMALLMPGPSHASSSGKPRWPGLRNWLRSLPSRIASSRIAKSFTGEQPSEKPTSATTESESAAAAAAATGGEGTEAASSPKQRWYGPNRLPLLSRREKTATMHSYVNRPQRHFRLTRRPTRASLSAPPPTPKRSICELLGHLLCQRGRRACGRVTLATIRRLTPSERAYVASAGAHAAKRKDEMARDLSGLSAQIAAVERKLDLYERVRNGLLFRRAQLNDAETERLLRVRTEASQLQAQLRALEWRKDMVGEDVLEAQDLVTFARRVAAYTPSSRR
ncbi:hypothetical protein JDV02_008293 [Purpureocillium takamizusanense]|uniref:Uncharacterized protein n=1 Tax=Purpureocillium takamizusanense TaxID=2060973 RepID=A0A9Q8QPZ4_9HYPO|nr:uncharacterized protein JDV02_008293 [Purpureocillium takamizusanense]UNI22402.1 hypothetical protein JDV02_008293 [Purpureocillium takamizusanense]